MKPAVRWTGPVEIINTKEFPLGKALYFGHNSEGLKMQPAIDNEMTKDINTGDKVLIQMSFNHVLQIKKV